MFFTPTASPSALVVEEDIIDGEKKKPSAKQGASSVDDILNMFDETAPVSSQDHIAPSKKEGPAHASLSRGRTGKRAEQVPMSKGKGRGVPRAAKESSVVPDPGAGSKVKQDGVIPLKPVTVRGPIAQQAKQGGGFMMKGPMAKMLEGKPEGVGATGASPLEHKERKRGRGQRTPAELATAAETGASPAKSDKSDGVYSEDFDADSPTASVREQSSPRDRQTSALHAERKGVSPSSTSSASKRSSDDPSRQYGRRKEVSDDRSHRAMEETRPKPASAGARPPAPRPPAAAPHHVGAHDLSEEHPGGKAYRGPHSHTHPRGGPPSIVGSQHMARKGRGKTRPHGGKRRGVGGGPVDYGGADGPIRTEQKPTTFKKTHAMEAKSTYGLSQLPQQPGLAPPSGVKSEVITPEPISPTFGYTKEKPPHNVGSWFRRLVGGASWETSPGDVTWEGGRGRPYYSSGPSLRTVV